jgi:hypothetical protein
MGAAVRKLCTLGVPGHMLILVNGFGNTGADKRIVMGCGLVSWTLLLLQTLLLLLPLLLLCRVKFLARLPCPTRSSTTRPTWLEMQSSCILCRVKFLARLLSPTVMMTAMSSRTLIGQSDVIGQSVRLGQSDVIGQDLHGDDSFAAPSRSSRTFSDKNSTAMTALVHIGKCSF